MYFPLKKVKMAFFLIFFFILKIPLIKMACPLVEIGIVSIILQLQRRDLSSSRAVIKERKWSVMIRWCLPTKTANNIALIVNFESILFLCFMTGYIQ